MRNLKRVAQLERKFGVKIQQPFGWHGNYVVYKSLSSVDIIGDYAVLDADAEREIEEKLKERE